MLSQGKGLDIFVFPECGYLHVCLSVQLSRSVVSDTLQPHGCSSPGFPVHQFLKLAETHVYRVGDAIQPSHPLSSPSPAFSLSQHQGLFKWVSSSHQVAKVLELQHQSFQWIFRTDFLQDRLVWSPCCARDFQESSPAPQFKDINSLALSFFYGPTLTSIYDYWKNHSFDIFENLSIITSKYEWMNGHKFIIYSMSSYGDKGNVLAYFVIFVCFIFYMVIQKVFVIIR